MEYILLIGYTIGVYFIGLRRGVNMMMDTIEDNDEYDEELGIINPEAEKTEVKKNDKIMIRIDYDEKEEYFFVHEEGTHKFMAHGKTWQEVEERLKERFPGQVFSIDEDHAKEIGMI